MTIQKSGNRHAVSNTLLYLRAISFYTGLLFLTMLFFFISLGALARPLRQRVRILSHWARLGLGWLSFCCDLRFSVVGKHHLTHAPSVILCNHQSAWEILALQLVLPPTHTWVMKKELLWLPLFGWGLATLRPIAISRTTRHAALRRVLKQGAARLARGDWVVIFPEGTRRTEESGSATKKYQIGGALLAKKTGHAVLPVAHNSGAYWPKNSLLKYPGNIELRIGKAISPVNKSAKQVLEEARVWIESQAFAKTPGTQ